MAKKKRRNNGEGSFYQNKKTGKWVYSYYDKSGKRKYVYGNTVKEIQIKLEEQKNNKISKSNATLYKSIEKYINDKYDLGKVNSNTYYTDCCTLKRISKYPMLHKPFSKITIEDIKNCLSEMRGDSQSTINKNCSLMKWGFEVAVSENYLDKNPMLNKLEITTPKSKKKTKKVNSFTLEEQQNFCTAINTLPNNYTYKYIWLISMYGRFTCAEKF